MGITPEDLVMFCIWTATICAVLGIGAGIADTLLRRDKDE